MSRDLWQPIMKPVRRFGMSNRQITPRVLSEAMATGGDVAKRAFEAMMTMQKIDVAAIEKAVRG